MKLHPILIANVLVASAAIAGPAAAPDKASGAQAAFARLKTLAGTWEANTNVGKVTVTYEVVSGGTALLERDSGEKMPTMLTAYHLDGDRLLLTHYCMMGNQPRLQARQYEANAGEIVFDFLDATNMPSTKAGHMHAAKFRFLDHDQYTSEWDFYENGTKKFAETATFSRVK